MTESCANKEAAASLVWWLTNEDSQKLEAAAGPLPTRTAVWDWDIKQAESDPYKTEVLTAFQEAAKHAFPVPQTPQWIEISNAVYPELQAAILGDKTSKEALDEAAAQGDADPPGRRQALRQTRSPGCAPPVHRWREAIASCASYSLGDTSAPCRRGAATIARQTESATIPGACSMKGFKPSAPFLLLLPAIIVLAAVVVVPLLLSFCSSFTPSA